MPSLPHPQPPLADDGTRLGAIALDHLDWQARTAELGYWLAARGRGVAARAVFLLTRWAFAELALARIAALIDADNSASQRTLVRRGLVPSGIVRDERGATQRRYLMSAPPAGTRPG